MELATTFFQKVIGTLIALLLLIPSETVVSPGAPFIGMCPSSGAASPLTPPTRRSPLRYICRLLRDCSSPHRNYCFGGGPGLRAVAAYYRWPYLVLLLRTSLRFALAQLKLPFAWGPNCCPARGRQFALPRIYGPRAVTS